MISLPALTPAAMSLLHPQPTDAELLDVCGDDPGWFCERVFDRTDNEGLAKAVDFLVAKPAKIILIYLVAYVCNRLLRKAIRHATEELQGGGLTRSIGRARQQAPIRLFQTDSTPSVRAAQRATTLSVVLRSVSTAVVYGLASLIALGELGINLGPLIAGAGIVGVALGFGAQSLVKDFLSGLFMLIEDQYGVGDVVDLGDATGEVEAVTLRITRLRDVHGTVWHVPNGEISRVGNMSQKWSRALLDVDVAYDADIDLARDVILSTAEEMAEDEEWRGLFLAPPELFGVQALGADGVTIRVGAKVVPAQQWRTERELRRRLKMRLDDAGIEIPFPQRTLWIRNQD